MTFLYSSILIIFFIILIVFLSFLYYFRISISYFLIAIAFLTFFLNALIFFEPEEWKYILISSVVLFVVYSIFVISLRYYQFRSYLVDEGDKQTFYKNNKKNNIEDSNGKYQASEIEFHKDKKGIVKSKRFYTDGKPSLILSEGDSRKYLPNVLIYNTRGELIEKQFPEELSDLPVIQRFYPDGKLKEEIYKKNSKLIKYYPDGITVKKKTLYTSGLISSLIKYFNSKSIKERRFYKDGKVSNDSLPAIEKLYFNGFKREQFWKVNGVFNQSLKYNYKSFYPDGSLFSEKFFNEKDQLSSQDKKSPTLFYFNNNISKKIYYRDGVIGREKDKPSILKYSNRNLEEEIYYYDGKIGREKDKPSITTHRQGYNIFQYYIDGKLRRVNFQDPPYIVQTNNKTYYYYISQLSDKIILYGREQDKLVYSSNNDKHYLPEKNEINKTLLNEFLCSQLEQNNPESNIQLANFNRYFLNTGY